MSAMPASFLACPVLIPFTEAYGCVNSRTDRSGPLNPFKCIDAHPGEKLMDIPETFTPPSQVSVIHIPELGKRQTRFAKWSNKTKGQKTIEEREEEERYRRIREQNNAAARKCREHRRQRNQRSKALIERVIKSLERHPVQEGLRPLVEDLRFALDNLRS